MTTTTSANPRQADRSIPNIANLIYNNQDIRDAADRAHQAVFEQAQLMYNLAASFIRQMFPQAKTLTFSVHRREDSVLIPTVRLHKIHDAAGLVLWVETDADDAEQLWAAGLAKTNIDGQTRSSLEHLLAEAYELDTMPLDSEDDEPYRAKLDVADQAVPTETAGTPVGGSYRFTQHNMSIGDWCTWSHVTVVGPDNSSGDRRCPANCTDSDIEHVAGGSDS